MSQITPVPSAYVDLAEKVDIWTAEAYVETLKDLANSGVPQLIGAQLSAARSLRERNLSESSVEALIAFVEKNLRETRAMQLKDAISWWMDYIAYHQRINPI